MSWRRGTLPPRPNPSAAASSALCCDLCLPCRQRGFGFAARVLSETVVQDFTLTASCFNECVVILVIPSSKKNSFCFFFRTRRSTCPNGAVRKVCFENCVLPCPFQQTHHIRCNSWLPLHLLPPLLVNLISMDFAQARSSEEVQPRCPGQPKTRGIEVPAGGVPLTAFLTLCFTLEFLGLLPGCLTFFSVLESSPITNQIHVLYFRWTLTESSSFCACFRSCSDLSTPLNCTIEQ